MKILCIGEVNLDYFIKRRRIEFLHWNGSDAKIERGGMVWHTAATLAALGNDVTLFAPHGPSFFEQKVDVSPKTLPFIPDFHDSVCLTLMTETPEHYTVYLPFQPASNYFRDIREILRESFGDDPQTIVYISCTEPTFDRLNVAPGISTSKIIINLSHVIEYWSPDRIKIALGSADLVMLNEAEYEILRGLVNDRFGEFFGHPLEAVIVTRGNQGVRIITSDHVEDYGLPFQVLKRDRHTGAGDSFAGGFIHGLSAGKDYPTAIYMGQQAAFYWLSKGRRVQTL